MNRRTIVSFFVLLAFPLISIAKTTYIPHYTGYIQIVMGDDTIHTKSKSLFFGLESQDKTIAISINHEVVDMDKVKAIKRAKRQAGWSTAAAVLSGISAGLNPGRTPQDAMRYVDQVRVMDASINLSKIARMNSDNEKVLKVTFTIENRTDQEISVSDMQRGLTWYVLPHQYLDLDADNPDMALLRIANTDPFHPDVKYATIEAGSYVTKESVEYEDDECIIYEAFDADRDGLRYKSGYMLYMKESGLGAQLSVKDGEDLVKIKKQNAKEKAEEEKLTDKEQEN